MKRTVLIAVLLLVICTSICGQELSGTVDSTAASRLYVDSEGDAVVQMIVSITPNKNLEFKGPIVNIVKNKGTEDVLPIPKTKRLDNGIIKVEPKKDSIYVFYINCDPSSKLSIYCSGIRDPYIFPEEIKDTTVYNIRLTINTSYSIKESTDPASLIEKRFSVFGTNVVLPFPNPLALLSLNVGYQWKSGWNLEGGLGFTPAATSDKIYVYDKSGENVTPQDYRKYQVYGHVGYDFGKNKDFCLMPQVGFAWDCITNKTFGKTDTSLNGFNTYSATLGLRLGYKFKISKTNKLLLYATPEIAKVWNSPTSNYEVISKNISSLKQTGDGLDFRLRIGLQLYLGGNKK